MRGRIVHLLSVFLLLTAPTSLLADPIAVRQTQGATRGFLVVRSEDGHVIAHGELNQIGDGDRVVTRLLYRFNDGSIDDDTATYTQRRTFHLLREHHIQKGPYFPKPSDYLLDVPSGNVTSRSTDKDGKEKVEVEHMDFPADLYNGMVGTILLNVAPTATFKIGMVAPNGKGRLIKLAIEPAGQGTVSIVGLNHKANIFRVKIELGGVTGAVAPIIGKKPADTLVWILPGPAPGLIRQVGQMYNEGPIVSIELSGTSFPREATKRP